MGEVQKKMKMGIHTEKAAVALDYCNPLSCVLPEQGTWADQHMLVGCLSTQVLVQSTAGLLGVYNRLNVGMQDNPRPLQREGSHCCLDPQKPPLDRDPQKHQAEGQELGHEE